MSSSVPGAAVVLARKFDASTTGVLSGALAAWLGRPAQMTAVSGRRSASAVGWSSDVMGFSRLSAGSACDRMSRGSSRPESGPSPGLGGGWFWVPSPVVENEWAPAVDLVADVGDIRSGNHTGRGEFDPLLSAQAEVGVEQAHAFPEDHRDDVEFQLVEEPELDHLAEQRTAAGDRHVLAIGSGAGLADRAFDARGDIREDGAALALQCRPGPVGDHEHRGTEWRVLAPGDLAAVCQAPPHHVSARRVEGLRDDVGVGVLLASLEALSLAPCLGIDDPPCDAEESGGFGALKPGLHVGVLWPGIEAVYRDRHLRGDDGHGICSFRWSGGTGCHWPRVREAPSWSSRPLVPSSRPSGLSRPSKWTPCSV